MVETPETAEVKSAPAKKEEFTLKEEHIQKLRSLAQSEDMKGLADFVDQTFEREYGKQAYEDSIRDFLTAEMKGAAPEVIDRMVKDSVARYGQVYRTAKAEFYKKVEQAIIKRKTIDNSISTAIGDSLSDASTEVTEQFTGKDDWPERLAEMAAEEQIGIQRVIENYQATQRARPKVEEKPIVQQEKTTFGGTWPHKIPLVGPAFENLEIPLISYLTNSSEYNDYMDFKEKTGDDFSGFVDALNTQYTDIERVRNQLTDDEFSEYKDLVGTSEFSDFKWAWPGNWFPDGFRQNAREYTNQQIDHIFDSAKTPEELKTRLEGLRYDLVRRYESISKKDGVIDLHELRRMKAETARYYDVMQIIQNETDEQVEARMESMDMFNRERWQQATAALTEQFIKDAENNGSEAAFIDGVKKITGKTETMDFDEAADLLRETMASRAQAGVKETLATAREFNKIAYGGYAEIVSLEDIKPSSIRILVTKERKLLLRRLTVPGNLDDQLVVEFMSTNREGRNRMLSHPDDRQKLYQAIQNIKEHYPKIYSKQYWRGIPRKISQLKTGYDAGHPTRHDRAARLLALVSIAKESEWVIKNLDRSDDYKKLSLTDELENTTAEAVPPTLSLKFRDVTKRHALRYRTKLHRGGFNGKDLFLAAAKIWAVATITVNVFGALTAARKKSKDGEGTFFGNFADFAVKTATNPYLLGGGAAFYAIGKYQKRPESAAALLEGGTAREQYLTHNSMDGLHKKISTRDLMGFVNNENEWRAMESAMIKPKQGVSKLKRLRDKARRNNSAYPTISKEDMRDVIDNEAVWSQLPDKGNERTRYLFYEKMLSTPRNMRELRENSQSWTT